jgi:hypothetical protein
VRPVSAIQVTGCSAAGKSSIAAGLARRGLAAVLAAGPGRHRYRRRPAARAVHRRGRPGGAGAGRAGPGLALPARLDVRRDYHDWGGSVTPREYLRRKRPELQARLRAAGAVPVDATRPLAQVVDAVLACSGA